MNTAISVISSGGPEALARCLASVSVYESTFGVAFDVSVYDASEDPSLSNKIRGLVRSFSVGRKSPVRFGGAREARRFSSLLSNHGINQEISLFALSGGGVSAARNSALVDRAGADFLMVRDAVTMRILPAPYDSGFLRYLMVDRELMTERNSDPTRLWPRLTESAGGDVIADMQAMAGRSLGETRFMFPDRKVKGLPSGNGTVMIVDIGVFGNIDLEASCYAGRCRSAAMMSADAVTISSGPFMRATCCYVSSKMNFPFIPGSDELVNDGANPIGWMLSGGGGLIAHLPLAAEAGAMTLRSAPSGDPGVDWNSDKIRYLLEVWPEIMSKSRELREQMEFMSVIL